MTSYVCPECGEPATASGLHLDGEPLCPVMGARGYEPAKPVEANSAEGQQVRGSLLDALGQDAALEVMRTGVPSESALGGALDRAAGYGLSAAESEAPLRAAFRRLRGDA